MLRTSDCHDPPFLRPFLQGSGGTLASSGKQFMAGRGERYGRSCVLGGREEGTQAPLCCRATLVFFSYIFLLPSFHILCAFVYVCLCVSVTLVLLLAPSGIHNVLAMFHLSCWCSVAAKSAHTHTHRTF